MGTKVKQMVAGRGRILSENNDAKIESKKWIHGRIEFKGTQDEL